MRKILAPISILTSLSITGCAPAPEPVNGFGITAIDTTQYGTKQKAMLVVNQGGQVICSKNFEQLPVVSEIHGQHTNGFQQVENNEAFHVGSTGLQIRRTKDELFSLVYQGSRIIMAIENKSGNGTQFFQNQYEYKAYLKKCEELKQK